MFSSRKIINSFTFKDFYQFSCGGFIKSKRIPDEQSRVDVFDGLRDNLAYDVAGNLYEFAKLKKRINQGFFLKIFWLNLLEKMTYRR